MYKSIGEKRINSCERGIKTEGIKRGIYREEEEGIEEREYKSIGRKRKNITVGRGRRMQKGLKMLRFIFKKNEKK